MAPMWTILPRIFLKTSPPISSQFRISAPSFISASVRSTGCLYGASASRRFILSPSRKPPMRNICCQAPSFPWRESPIFSIFPAWSISERHLYGIAAAPRRSGANRTGLPQQTNPTIRWENIELQEAKHGCHTLKLVKKHKNRAIKL